MKELHVKALAALDRLERRTADIRAKIEDAGIPAMTALLNVIVRATEAESRLSCALDTLRTPSGRLFP